MGTSRVVKLHISLCGMCSAAQIAHWGAGDFCELAWHSGCLEYCAFFSTVKYWLYDSARAFRGC
jgi:hypothetical protein